MARKEPEEEEEMGGRTEQRAPPVINQLLRKSHRENAGDNLRVEIIIIGGRRHTKTGTGEPRRRAGCVKKRMCVCVGWDGVVVVRVY